MRLLKAYCSSFYASELWDLANDSMETLDKTWRNALRRIFHSLPIPKKNTNILNILNDNTPLYDVFCQRSLKFIRSCLCSRNAVVNFIARHGVTYGRMRSLFGRNVQLCSEKYKVNDLVNPNFSLRCTANVCKQYVESEMTDRSTLVWELLKVKDGLSCLSNEQFNVLDVCGMMNWLCTY